MNRHDSAARTGIGTLTFLLAMCSMIGPFATDMYLPSFHLLQEAFSATQAQVQQSLSFYLAGFALMTLFCGTVSDVTGRRPAMIGGFVFFTAASVGAALSPSLAWLHFFRFLEGLSAGCGLVIGMAVVRDLFGGIEAQKVMANIAMVFAFGPAVAPVVGGFFATHMDWPSCFWFLAALGCLLAALNAKLLPESLPKEKRTPVSVRGLIAGYARALRSPVFVLSSLALAVSFMGPAAMIAGAADWCGNIRGYSPDEYWKMFLPMILGIVAGSWASSRLSMRFGTEAAIRIALAVLAVSGLWAVAVPALFPQAGWILAVSPLAFFNFGSSLLRPGMTLVILDLLPESRGLASSLLNFLQTLLFCLMSAVLVPMFYGNVWAYAVNFPVVAVLCTVLWTAACRLRAKNHRRSEEIAL